MTSARSLFLVTAVAGLLLPGFSCGRSPATLPTPSAPALTAERLENLLARERAVYGNDTRIDVGDLRDAVKPTIKRRFGSERITLSDEDTRRILERAGGVAICVSSDQLESVSGGHALRVAPLGILWNLCDVPAETFRRQPAAGGHICTAFLVADDVVATARHCFEGLALDRTRFVFGFEAQGLGTPRTTFTENEVYAGARIEHEGDDWALVRLARHVDARFKPLPLSKTPVASDADFYLLGYPAGLPAKLSYDGTIDMNEDSQVFTVHLDFWQGNSGSPVLNAGTHEVEGLAIGSESTFYFPEPGQCRRTSRCVPPGCGGAAVLRIARVRPK